MDYKNTEMAECTDVDSAIIQFYIQCKVNRDIVKKDEFAQWIVDIA